MATIYSEPAASRLSISLEGEASASPFPSPSSSFLPPPTPGAHEFAMKPAPSARNGRKSSIANTLIPKRDEEQLVVINGDSVSKSQRSSVNGVEPHVNGSCLPLSVKDGPAAVPLTPTLLSSPMTPTPSTFQQRQTVTGNHLEPPFSPAVYFTSSSSSTTPTIAHSDLPPDLPSASESDIDATTANTTKELNQDGPVLSKIIVPSFQDFSSTAEGGPSSPAFSSNSRPVSTSIDPSLYSNRPAPPSPAMSRRVSGAPSSCSARSRSSKPPSAAVSRASSLRKPTASTRGGSPVINPHPNRHSLGSQLSLSFAPLPSPQTLSFSLNTPMQAQSQASGSASSPLSAIPHSAVTASKRASAIVYIKVRDFAFPSEDERHVGLGEDVPKPNKVARMNRRLGSRRTLSQSSFESSDGEGGIDGEEEDDEGWGGGGWDTFRTGLGRFSWNGGAGAAGGVGGKDSVGNGNGNAKDGGFPSQTELDQNFLDDESDTEQEHGDEDQFYDAIDAEEEEEETLYPGLYRAVYAFEPEGTAEMGLEEDQIVRVIGRGGGVGWAVVIDERAGEGQEGVLPPGVPKHALVPESYLEPVRFDWEDEEAAVNA
ncbi:hypothetical protein B0H34DRAFT_199148 [Crassisporium funariophilum]|nr:hypothetical protein B0H34DRAFT_199148 [Crassisporium funariophilum]